MKDTTGHAGHRACSLPRAIKNVCVCVCVCVCMYVVCVCTGTACESQRTTWGNQLSPSIMWVPEVELKPSIRLGWQQVPLPTESSC